MPADAATCIQSVPNPSSHEGWWVPWSCPAWPNTISSSWENQWVAHTRGDTVLTCAGWYHGQPNVTHPLFRHSQADTVVQPCLAGRSALPFRCPSGQCLVVVNANYPSLDLPHGQVYCFDPERSSRFPPPNHSVSATLLTCKGSGWPVVEIPQKLFLTCNIFSQQYPLHQHTHISIFPSLSNPEPPLLNLFSWSQSPVEWPASLEPCPPVQHPSACIGP